MLRQFSSRIFGEYTNPSRVHLDRWICAAAASISDGAQVLDAGAGDALYAHHFSHKRYHTTDFGLANKAYARLDYVCDLSALPVRNEVYDLIVCTQVLEHVPDPGEVLAEFRRVLKPSGALWLSAPLFYEEHEQPYDFYRYTQFALRRLVESAGLAIRSIDWMEGYYGTLSYELHFAAFSLRPVAPKLVRLPLSLALEVLARWTARLDLKERVTTVGMPINYCVVATREA
jgi:SAM-dependent methyltransferase